MTLNSYDKLEKVRGQQCVSHGTCLPVKGVTAAMMDVVVRKSRAIRSIYEQDRALFLKTELGLIRIRPLPARNILVSKTENGVFPEN